MSPSLKSACMLLFIFPSLQVTLRLHGWWTQAGRDRGFLKLWSQSLKAQDQSVVMIPKHLECVKDECKYPEWKQLIFLFTTF